MNPTFGPRAAQRKYAFEDGDVVQLSDGSVGIYSGDDWLGMQAPEGKVWVTIDGDVAAVDPSEVSAFKQGRREMRTETEIIQDLQKASSLQDRRELVRELDEFRSARSAQIRGERQLDLANAVIRDTLTPVIAHQRHTSDTDWIMEEAVSSGNYDHQMRTEATLWFRKVSKEVKSDREEFGEQAMGMARRVSGQFGYESEGAYRAFLDQVARLYKQADDKPGEVDVDQSGNAESTVTDYDTKEDQDPMWSEDWQEPTETGDGYHPPMPGAGEGSNTVGRRKTAEEGQTCSVCGDSIERDPAGEEPRTWHHTSGGSHDHEAKPSGDGEKESSRRTALKCSCAHNNDGSVTTMLCPLHADQDPCLTMAQVTGNRRKGSIINGVCTNCGWTEGSRPIASRRTANSEWYDAGFARGQALALDGVSLDEAPDPLSGEWAGESIPEIFGSWEAATEDALEDYEEGFYAAFTASRRVVNPKDRRAAGRTAAQIDPYDIARRGRIPAQTKSGRVAKDITQAEVEAGVDPVDLIPGNTIFGVPILETTDSVVWLPGDAPVGISGNNGMKAVMINGLTDPSSRITVSTSKTAASPDWLQERNSDPYGTPNRHPFWDTVDWEDVGDWRIFERDGSWFGYKRTQNAWSTPRPSREDILQMAAPENQIDVWASLKEARQLHCNTCGSEFSTDNQFKVNCPVCGSIEVSDTSPSAFINWGSRRGDWGE